MARDLDPGHPGLAPEQPRPLLPPTLLHAAEAMLADQEVCAALDVAGGQVSQYFAGLKRAEFFVWHAAISDWEIERYLTALLPSG